MSDVNKWMIDLNDAVLLMIDHQSGLFQLVRDIDQAIRARGKPKPGFCVLGCG